MQYQGKDSKTYEQVSKWLLEYRNEKDSTKKSKIKTRIVTNMLPIVKRIAKTIARRDYDPIEDLEQAGSIGLLRAIDSYSSEVNDNFRFYAGSVIIGEMKHYLRDKLNAIKVPRYIQELAYRINSFTSSLTYEELSELTSDYVSEALNVTTQEVDYAMMADRRTKVISLEVIRGADSDNMTFDDILPAEDYVEASELADARLIVRNVINKLPDEYKEIIELYYYEDMSQHDIAVKLEMTDMQTSRKLKKAFGMLYEMIADSNWEFPVIGA